MAYTAKHPTYVVLGSGGHTAEMCEIMKSLFANIQEEPNCYFIVAQTDETSKRKLTDVVEFKTKPNFIEIPRSRQVNQSYLTSVFTTLWSAIFCFFIVFRDKPKMILCNGPGTCVPICVVAALYRFLRILDKQTQIVFIESFCRVKTLSLTGKILLRVVDLFVVQWESLVLDRKNVKYFGPLM